MFKSRLRIALTRFFTGSASEGVELKQEFFDYILRASIIFTVYELATCFMLKKGAYCAITVGVYLFYSTMLYIYTTRIHNTEWYRSLYISFCFTTCCLYLPVLYLFGGAIDSGVPLLFIVGELMIFLLLDNLTMFGMLATSLVSFIFMYRIDFNYPGFADQFTVMGDMTYAEIPITTIIVGVGCGFVLRVLVTRLDNEQEKADALLRQIETSSNRDPLTGAYNRRFLIDSLDKCIKQVKDGEMKTFSILMFDIDHFKNVNDTYGHLAGDDCLEALVYILQKNLRRVDVVSRYGGEEFICVLPTADETPAFRRAEQIRASVEASQLSADIKDRVITVSGGVAMYEPGMTAQQLINLVDENLYLAKENGRNQIVWHKGGIPPLCYVVYDATSINSTESRKRRFTDRSEDIDIANFEKE